MIEKINIQSKTNKYYAQIFEFFMPQLNKSRKVWALLPFDYHKTDKEYPVLYLQDAQNLFNEGSEFGNWEIDKKLSILSEYGRGDIIIIAI